MVFVHSLLALAASTSALAQNAGQFVEVGSTRVSAMMMFLGNEEKVYIMDKVEGNQDTINGHPAWASVWDIASKKADLLDFRSNAFCASGAHFPNASFMTFGGNGAVTVGGDIGSEKNPGGFSANFDKTYGDFDGVKSIRVIKPCTGDVSTWDSDCQWFDDASQMAMQRARWYSTAESLGDGSVALIGGFTAGGYINRNGPGTACDGGGAAENSYEFWPSRGDAQPMPFMCKTAGLNAYAHSYLMPSGKMFIQANYSAILWDPDTGAEQALPDTPKQVVWVYPASGAAAMLPLTPDNGYNPTILFCGGQDGDTLPDSLWGNYAHPVANTFDLPASKACQRITPEPADGSAVAYTADDDMLDSGRTMGQFVILPTGEFLVINGAAKGTAGYADQTGQTAPGQMPFGMSLAADPTLKPALYDPSKPAGQRWSDAGLGTSQIPRLYHSTALLLPDGSVMVAGSNPNVDVNFTVPYKTEYRAEYFYPPYFNASARPAPTGIPKTISYGGASFDLTVPAKGFTGNPNTAAATAKVMLIRPGWTTHAMSMGQRALQLNSTFSVSDDGDIVLHTSQAPPNSNILTPGPALLFVVVNGVPSIGKQVIVGNGVLGTQPTAAAAALPASVTNANVKTSSSSSGSGSSSGNSGSGSSSSGNGDDSNATKPNSGASSRAVSSILSLVGAAAFLAALV
jgi:hypothetical protein